uniref:Uncharacterized protein n=1 Tax=Anguilla anguilla TaxID=7936 RepID=A0A0E9V0I6_ANGAN
MTKPTENVEPHFTFRRFSRI